MIVENEPVKIGINAYDQQLEKYLDVVKKVRGVQTIYTMGSVGTPGLSDLDIVVVLNDSFDKKDSSKLYINRKDYDKNIFLHQSVIIPDYLLQDIKYLICTDHLKIVGGTGNNIDKIIPRESMEKKILALMYIIDISLSRLCQTELVLNLDRIDKRIWLTRLWSLTHTVALCNQVGIKLSIEAKATLEEIKSMRAMWKESLEISNTHLIRTFYGAKEALNEIIIKAIKLESAFLECSNQNNATYQSGERRIKCEAEQHVAEVKVKEFSLLKRKKLYYDIKLPREFRCHLELYKFKPLNESPFELGSQNDIYNLFTKRAKSARELGRFLKAKDLLYAQKANLGLPYQLTYKDLIISRAYWNQWLLTKLAK